MTYREWIHSFCYVGMMEFGDGPKSIRLQKDMFFRLKMEFLGTYKKEEDMKQLDSNAPIIIMLPTGSVAIELAD